MLDSIAVVEVTVAVAVDVAGLSAVGHLAAVSVPDLNIQVGEGYLEAWEEGEQDYSVII